MSDIHLLVQISKGDSKAFESLFRSHKNIVYGLSLRILGAKMLAEENSQDVWIKVVEKASQFQGQGSVKSWLLSITRNSALNIIKKRGWETNLSPEKESAIVEESKDIEFKLDEREQIEKLKKGIDQLPERQRVALVLWMSEDLSYNEIAAELELNTNALKVLLHRAKINLKQIIKEGGDEKVE